MVMDGRASALLGLALVILAGLSFSACVGCVRSEAVDAGREVWTPSGNYYAPGLEEAPNEP